MRIASQRRTSLTSAPASILLHLSASMSMSMSMSTFLTCCEWPSARATDKKSPLWRKSMFYKAFCCIDEAMACNLLDAKQVAIYHLAAFFDLA